MTPSTETQQERALRAAFARRAGDIAWSPVLLPEPGVFPGRRRWLPVAVAAAAVVAVIGSAVAVQHQVRPDRPRPVATADATKPAPNGWRWESYGGVQLLVPSSWGWETGPQPWCLRENRPVPTVARPGTVLLIKCGSDYAPIERRAPMVTLGPSGLPKPGAATRSVGGGWTVTRRVVNNVAVVLFDNDPARDARILDSLQVVRTLDAYGCPTVTPAGDPAWRPHDSALAALIPAAAPSVTICRFLIHQFRIAWSPPPLLSSARVTGTQARTLVKALAAAPRGHGPDAPGQCSSDTVLGDELAVVTVTTPTAASQVVVRYSGCTGHGTDDGQVTRRLTRPVLTGLLTGPNTSTSYNGVVGPLTR